MFRGVRLWALDLETTGLDPAVDEIVELALVEVHSCRSWGKGGKSWEDTFDFWDRGGTLVRPMARSVAEVTTINGLTDAELSDAPTWSEARPRVLRRDGNLGWGFHRSRWLTAWNWPFDGGFLVASDKRIGLNPRVWLAQRVLDGRLWAKWLWPDESARLRDVAQRFGFSQAEPHRAHSDAVLTARVLLRLWQAVEERLGRTMSPEKMHAWQRSIVLDRPDPEGRIPTWRQWLDQVDQRRAFGSAKTWPPPGRISAAEEER